MLKKYFFFILGCGFLLSIIQKDKLFSDYENRKLQTFPSFSFSTILDGSFTSALDNYTTDQFLARNYWIAIKTMSDITLFQKASISDVYLGKNDYLIDRYTEKDFSKEILTQNIAILNRFVDNYQAQVILVPTASEVLEKNLPSAYYHIDQNTLFTKEVNSDFSALSTLKKYDSEPLYFKTDHHWTLRGAYYVYKAISDDPLPYEVTVASDSFLGTTFRKLNIATSSDVLEQFVSPNEFTVSYDNNAESSSLYNNSALEKIDKYPFYLDGNHAITHIRNKSSSKENSLLIIKDSFANSFATLICNDYKDVYLIDLRYFNGSISAYIEKHNIEETMFLYNNINFMQDKNLAKLLF